MSYKQTVISLLFIGLVVSSMVIGARRSTVTRSPDSEFSLCRFAGDAGFLAEDHIRARRQRHTGRQPPAF